MPHIPPRSTYFLSNSVLFVCLFVSFSFFQLNNPLVCADSILLGMGLSVCSTVFESVSPSL